MTEEIIIDGVNVAECYYMYDNEDLDYMCQENAGTCVCRENKNCYYKQLKRLKQENTKLKKKLEKMKDIVAQNYGCKCALEELMNVFIEGAKDV